MVVVLCDLSDSEEVLTGNDWAPQRIPEGFLWETDVLHGSVGPVDPEAFAYWSGPAHFSCDKNEKNYSHYLCLDEIHGKM